MLTTNLVPRVLVTLGFHLLKHGVERMRSRTRSARMLSGGSLPPEVLVVPPLEKGNEESWNEIGLQHSCGLCLRLCLSHKREPCRLKMVNEN